MSGTSTFGVNLVQAGGISAGAVTAAAIAAGAVTSTKFKAVSPPVPLVAGAAIIPIAGVIPPDLVWVNVLLLAGVPGDLSAVAGLGAVTVTSSSGADISLVQVFVVAP
jgi:hypothetical protein